MFLPVLMPRLGETVVEGTVSRWLAAEGDAVHKLAPLLEISTDKIDTEIPSPVDGVLAKIHAQAGVVVPAGGLLAEIALPASTVSEPLPPAALPETPQPASLQEPDGLPAATSFPTAAAAPAPTDLGFISPVVARLVREYGVDLRHVHGTGLRGRIRKQDVLAFVEQRASSPGFPPPLPSPAAADTVAESNLVPLDRMRRLMAEHMVRSVHTSPHVTTVFDCDLTAVVRHREANKETFTHAGADLTFTPYFVAAVVSGLQRHPHVNASWVDTPGGPALRLHRGIHVGIAVAIDGGLLVPVLRSADSFNLLGLARAVSDLARHARSGLLQPDEIQGGTFTLTNHGTGGSLFATPIINQPQTGILGVGRIHKAAVVLSRGHALLPSPDDAIAIRPLAYLSFTFDHRILDGAAADAFVTTVKLALEQWPA